MSTYLEMDYTKARTRQIQWDETRTKAAYLLARGYGKTYTAEQIGVTRATIYNWLDDPEFHMEVDRLTLMVDVASRAERLREAYRILRNRRLEDGSLPSDRDTLDWLKYAQSETDGAKIDLTKLAELFQGNQDEQAQLPPAIDTELDHVGPPQLVEPTDTDHNP